MMKNQLNLQSSHEKIKVQIMKLAKPDIIHKDKIIFPTLKYIHITSQT